MDILSAVIALSIALVSYFTSLRTKLDNAGKQDKLHYLSTHDPLTGLLNRTAFEEMAEAAIAGAQGSYALCMMDLDRFKTINDEQGHVMGDNVLKSFSAAIKAAFCPEGGSLTAGRFGGDEFLAFLPAVRSQEEVYALLSGFNARVARMAQEYGLEITCSVGVVLAAGRDWSLHSLLHHADEALYRAKRDEDSNCELTRLFDA